MHCNCRREADLMCNTAIIILVSDATEAIVNMFETLSNANTIRPKYFHLI